MACCSLRRIDVSSETKLKSAILTDAQHRPLIAESITAVVTHEDGSRQQMVMRQMKDSPREGSFFGTFTTQKIGDYRIELRPPDARDDDVLTREVRVLAPQLETERPERNDPLLAELAQKTDGQYYVGLDTAHRSRLGTPSIHRQCD